MELESRRKKSHHISAVVEISVKVRIVLGAQKDVGMNTNNTPGLSAEREWGARTIPNAIQRIKSSTGVQTLTINVNTNGH